MDALEQCPTSNEKIKVAIIDNAFDISHQDF
jgi:hypothetical protein